MMKLSRGAMAAQAAAVAIPTGVAIAKTFDQGGWGRMSPETRQRLDEGKLAMAKTALKLSPEQEKLWAPVEAEVRTAFKLRADRMAERQKMREERMKAREENKDGKQADTKRPDLAERFEKMSTRMSERAERMKAFSTAFKPFYASLSDEQKDVLRPLMRQLSPGGGGHGHGGPRWAMGGGWGGPGGWGHHGGGRHGHGDRMGGPDGERGEHRGGGAPGGDRAPPAPQFMPDGEGDDAGDAAPVAPDRL